MGYQWHRSYMSVNGSLCFATGSFHYCTGRGISHVHLPVTHGTTVRVEGELVLDTSVVHTHHPDAGRTV